MRHKIILGQAVFVFEKLFDMCRFHEDVYVMKDPFTDEKRCMVLGSKCAVCQNDVCVSQVNRPLLKVTNVLEYYSKDNLSPARQQDFASDMV